MTLKKTLILATLIASGSALAQSGHHGHKHHRPDLTSALAQIKISAQDAIASAEKDSNARAYTLELDLRHGKATYDIELFDDKQEHDIRIDAATGDIIARSSEYEDKLPRSAKLSLSDAIANAEHELGGKVIDAELEGKSAAMSYDIKLIKEDGTRIRADINGEDGKILNKTEKTPRKNTTGDSGKPAPAADQTPNT